MSVSVKEIVLVLPAWIGAVVAVLGLSAWRRQLHGKETYELVRRLLRATYRYRDAIQRARGPFSIEAASPPPAEGASGERERLGEKWGRRWEGVESARQELEAELIEAEVLFGSSHRDVYMPLFEVDSQLYVSILEHLDNMGLTAEQAGESREHRVARREKLYARIDRSDGMSKQLEAAVAKVETLLRPRLRKLDR